MTPERIVMEARRYLGVRFKHQGRTMAGIDCAGLIIQAASGCGLATEDVVGYARRPDGYQLMRLLNEHLDKVDSVRIGDVMLFAYAAYPQHLAIRTDKGIIHANAAARRVVEHVYDQTWQDRFVQGYRFRGL